MVVRDRAPVPANGIGYFAVKPVTKAGATDQVRSAPPAPGEAPPAQPGSGYHDRNVTQPGGGIPLSLRIAHGLPTWHDVISGSSREITKKMEEISAATEHGEPTSRLYLELQSLVQQHNRLLEGHAMAMRTIRSIR